MSAAEKITRIKRRLALYYEAEEAILHAQEYRIGSRSLTRADLEDVQEEISKLEAEVDALETRGNTKRRVRHVTWL